MSENTDLLATVASLYYNLNQSQAEIASRLDISPSKVSRLIKEAKERGIVEIRIHMPIPRNLELEQALIREFQLKDAYILRTSADSDGEVSLDGLGKLAANYLERVIDTLKPGAIIGVAWGTGVHAAVLALPNRASYIIDVVQLMGGVGALSVDGPDLARVISEKLGGRHFDLHAPVLVEKAATREMFLAEPAVRNGILRAQSAQLAITGIGAIHEDSSSFLRAGLLNRADLFQLRDQGVVGEICGRFYDIHGNWREYEINQRIIGIELENLRQIPYVLTIARGNTKVLSILGALQGKFIKILVTDDITARAILETNSQSLQSGLAKF